MLRHFMGLGGLMVVGALALGACGSDDKPEPEIPPDPYPTFASFCAGVASSQCLASVQKACALNSDDGTLCKQEVTDRCIKQEIDITRGIKTTNYRKDRAEACLGAIGAVYNTAKIDAADHGGLLKACRPVFQGSQAKGAGCVEDLDCGDGLGCYFASFTDSEGTCQTINKKVVGDDCSAVGDVCDDGLYCAALAEGGNNCLKGSGQGGVCNPARPCQVGLICTNPDADGKGTCGAKTASSATSTCDSDEQCVSGFCAQLGTRQACLDIVGFAAGAPICDNFDGQ